MGGYEKVLESLWVTSLQKKQRFFISTFELENGEIGLYIASEVRLQYTDKINSEINESEKNANIWWFMI